MNDYTGELFVIGGIMLTAVLGWIGSILVKRAREPMRIETLWTRLDAMTKTVYGDPNDPKSLGLLGRLTLTETRAENAERQASAAGRVIRDVARQWEGEPPRLNPTDLDELAEIFPATHPWRKS